MSIEFRSVTPILRIFDIAKADEFYVGYLGFNVDWEHRFGYNAPLYRQVSRGGLVLHLSEHHGDGNPGVHVRVEMKGLAAYHGELAAKEYKYMNPGIEEGPAPGSLELAVIDPFGNRITFCQDGEGLTLNAAG
ncbi:serine threonine protein phosphatase 2b catalytic subunit protein [Purpureocillium lavendulum]|uniref:Bleomycin resistance protein n=1 Tax=Purpureocillium lavendulum TaxID=1247861 RepID=A0AB34FFY9_9HYPO|nr:serine threonine protein phosphatase 2b catalytic subunit protein [Purpureocillium lavendulum]